LVQIGNAHPGFAALNPGYYAAMGLGLPVCPGKAREIKSL